MSVTHLLSISARESERKYTDFPEVGHHKYEVGFVQCEVGLVQCEVGLVQTSSEIT